MPQNPSLSSSKLAALVVDRTYRVAVRTLCEFTAKQGDLDLRFTPSATALEGVVGQNVVVARRGPGYLAELSLSGEFENLTVRGRADGYDADANRLEEIKAFRGDLNAMPDNRRHLHWAQVKVYGALLCTERGLKEVHLALVYFDVGNQEETVLTELFSTADLQAFFQDQCRRFAAWAAQEQAHRVARDEALRALKFPHAEFRAGQRPLSEAVFKAASSGRCLLAQAPTGIGKTVGTLFPLLKAAATQGLDKVFYLAAKTPGRGLALDALNTLRSSAPDMPLRILELVARDKACEHPDKACHGESCPLAQGFYDRLPLARLEALTVPQMDKAALRAVALQHQICPYYLAQEMVRWSDVVVGDYNYYFDLNAMLYGMTLASQWRVGLLVDEAHNLIERARGMYSAELARSQLSAARSSAPSAIKASLNRLLRTWVELENQQTQNYTVCKELPVNFMGALSNVNAAFAEHLAAHPEGTPAALLGVYFDTLHFSRMCDSYAEHSLFDISLIATGDIADIEPTDSVLCVRNIVPAPFLKARFQAAHTATLFSATLSPTAYHLDLMGLPEDTVCVDVASPFSASQLKVQTHRHMSTRYKDRGVSVQPIVDLMARQFAQAPGNYLAFFSSFDYLQKVARALQAQHPDTPTWAQSRAMLEAEREQFLARFTPHSRGIAFAVLGGAFAEGIDLPGRRLIGAFIATLGLPQVNPVNEQIKDRMQALFGQPGEPDKAQGQNYTYLYPGLQKVVQAAGRVIRTTSDQGVLHLMDDRFARAEVKALLPAWWRVDG
ncbi:MAG: ATP-dependent DNA helicase [Pseudorhodobacter sp.]|nr:ATP-dependent DNA helicase [Rhizobacter sp.]